MSASPPIAVANLDDSPSDGQQPTSHPQATLNASVVLPRDIETPPAKASSVETLATVAWSFLAHKASPLSSFHIEGGPSSSYLKVSRLSLFFFISQRDINRKHTGERPFACHCGKQFSRLDNLRQHAQTVHSDKPELNERMMKELTTLHTSLSTSNARVHARPSGSTAERRRGAQPATDSTLAQRPGTSTGYEAADPGQRTDFRDSFRTNDFREGRADQFRDTRSSRTSMGTFGDTHPDQQQVRQVTLLNGDGRHSFLDSAATASTGQSFLASNNIQRDNAGRGQRPFTSSSITPSRSGLPGSGSLGRPSNIQSPGTQQFFQRTGSGQSQQFPQRRLSPNFSFASSVEQHSSSSRPGTGTGVGLPPISEIVSPTISARFNTRPPSQSGVPSTPSSSHQHNPFAFTYTARPGTAPASYYQSSVGTGAVSRAGLASRGTLQLPIQLPLPGSRPTSSCARGATANNGPKLDGFGTAALLSNESPFSFHAPEEPIEQQQPVPRGIKRPRGSVDLGDGSEGYQQSRPSSRRLSVMDIIDADEQQRPVTATSASSKQRCGQSQSVRQHQSQQQPSAVSCGQSVLESVAKSSTSLPPSFSFAAHVGPAHTYGESVRESVSSRSFYSIRTGTYGAADGHDASATNGGAYSPSISPSSCSVSTPDHQRSSSKFGDESEPTSSANSVSPPSRVISTSRSAQSFATRDPLPLSSPSATDQRSLSADAVSTLDGVDLSHRNSRSGGLARSPAARPFEYRNDATSQSSYSPSPTPPPSRVQLVFPSGASPPYGTGQQRREEPRRLTSQLAGSPRVKLEHVKDEWERSIGGSRTIDELRRQNIQGSFPSFLSEHDKQSATDLSPTIPSSGERSDASFVPRGFRPTGGRRWDDDDAGFDARTNTMLDALDLSMGNIASGNNNNPSGGVGMVGSGPNQAGSETSAGATEWMGSPYEYSGLTTTSATNLSANSGQAPFQSGGSGGTVHYQGHLPPVVNLPQYPHTAHPLTHWHHQSSSGLNPLNYHQQQQVYLMHHQQQQQVQMQMQQHHHRQVAALQDFQLRLPQKVAQRLQRRRPGVGSGSETSTGDQDQDRQQGSSALTSTDETAPQRSAQQQQPGVGQQMLPPTSLSHQQESFELRAPPSGRLRRPGIARTPSSHSTSSQSQVQPQSHPLRREAFLALSDEDDPELGILRPASAALSSPTVGGGSGSSRGDAEFEVVSTALSAGTAGGDGVGSGHDEGMSISEFGFDMDLSGSMNMDMSIGMNVNEWGEVGVSGDGRIDMDMMFDSPQDQGR
ncbi:uncharacterized protein EI90DRAFT_3018801 [Cantharellus anzutake]|uniref:uncharacterized protein n=1 Tax=Cantharellus anzutake TaxID=1750568 RepID=UPI001907143F|nr:uncharacterized protein EI90DRAFT_3018801 [Cantharellus anzutake]KAF8326081.1 hypothetical protein EI90DRAFT_3018801 [Cantharellus anzutake]